MLVTLLEDLTLKGFQGQFPTQSWAVETLISAGVSFDSLFTVYTDLISSGVLFCFLVFSSRVSLTLSRRDLGRPPRCNCTFSPWSRSCCKNGFSKPVPLPMLICTLLLSFLFCCSTLIFRDRTFFPAGTINEQLAQYIVQLRSFRSSDTVRHMITSMTDLKTQIEHQYNI